MAKYFRLVASIGTPTFRPINHYMGVWYGVAEVNDDVEIARLTAAGCQEITEAEYEDQLAKKKALDSSTGLDFRPLHNGAAQPAAPKAPEPPKDIKAEDLRSAETIPAPATPPVPSLPEPKKASK